jgi:L-serine dehydratase
MVTAAGIASQRSTVNKALGTEQLSVFDMFKIGVGPSSSHTMGPWRATQRFIDLLRSQPGGLGAVQHVRCDLFGSLSKTGKGHGTDVAVILALAGEDPVTCDTLTLDARVGAIRASRALSLDGQRAGFAFNPATDIVFNDTTHPGHPNAMTLTARLAGGGAIARTYFSVGGGFVQTEGEEHAASAKATPPVIIDTGQHLLDACARAGANIPQIVLANEHAWRSPAQVRQGILDIWRAMESCIWRGCHTFGRLPGGLNVVRRAAEMNQRLLGVAGGYFADHTGEDIGAWTDAVRAAKRDFVTISKWVSCFALAVNEENACFGRVVTAPTNGAAGVIPAVLMYDQVFNAPADLGAREQRVIDFLLAAGVVGALFKKGATISAAMGGCQAEIGVSSAMAAAGLMQVTGGELATPARVLMAAEIAMEHHLGMTCDPIAGLVQVPCIERNTMGAIKAITATNIASDSDPATAKVSFDDVVRTMWHTALDMQSKYKETAEGGLAVNITVGLSEC